MSSLLRSQRAVKLNSLCSYRLYSNEGAVRESGGEFGKKSQASENKFIYDHDKTLLKNLADMLKSGKKASQEKPDTEKSTSQPTAESTKDSKKFDPLTAGPVRTGGSHGSFNEREVAYEDKFIRDRERDRLEKEKK